MPASLNSLPPELLGHIAGYLGKSKWLFNLALCCRSTYDLVLPYLYRDIKLTRGMKEPYLRLRVLGERIFENPILASHVRSFTTDILWHVRSESGRVDENSDELARKTTLVRNAFSKYIVASTIEENWITLLLPWLPHLERLDLHIPDTRDRDLYLKMFEKVVRREQPFDTRPVFSSLRVIVNHHALGSFFGTWLDYLSTYIQLPSLQEYYGRNVTSPFSPPHQSLASLKPASVTLIHLELRNSRLAAKDFNNMMRSFQSLNTLVYHIGWTYSEYYTYSSAVLWKALKFVEHSLENLWVDYEREDSAPHWDFGSDDLTPINSLTGLKVLKNVRAGMFVFYNGIIFGETESDAADGDTINFAQLLPSSLETIFFTQTKGKMRVLIRALENWLQQKEFTTPQLKRVGFETYVSGEQVEFDYSHLESLARDANVKLDKLDGTGLCDEDFESKTDEAYPWANGRSIRRFASASNSFYGPDA